MACAVALAAQAVFSRAGDAMRGQQLYESRCGGCHSLAENRAGPAHCGVFGRKAGSTAGYEYSAALKSSRVVWNERNLDRWLTNPEALIPGQRMGFSVPEAADRADIIEYLRYRSEQDKQHGGRERAFGCARGGARGLRR